MDMREREKGKFHFKIITVSVFPREKDIKIKPRRGSTAMSLSSECCLRKMNFFILFCSYLIKKIQMRFLVSLAMQIPSSFSSLNSHAAGWILNSVTCGSESEFRSSNDE